MDDTEIQNRIGKVWAKYGIFREELNDRNVPLRLRLRLVDAIITPTVLYGCEVWAMTKERQLKLRTAQRKMFRQLTQAHRHHPNYPDHISWLRASTKKSRRQWRITA